MNWDQFQERYGCLLGMLWSLAVWVGLVVLVVKACAR